MFHPQKKESMRSLVVNTFQSLLYKIQSVKKHIKTQYGGKKECISYCYYKGMYLFNKTDLKEDQWRKIKRLVFVCTGNICRSPYAQMYAQQIGLQSVSYGLIVHHKSPADPTAVEAALKKNIDLSTHRSTSIEEYVHKDGDILLIFEPYHARLLKQLNLHIKAPVVLLGQCHPKRIPYIRDPFMTDIQNFEQCYAIIDVAIDKVKTAIMSNV